MVADILGAGSVVDHKVLELLHSTKLGVQDGGQEHNCPSIPGPLCLKRCVHRGSGSLTVKLAVTEGSLQAGDGGGE